MSKADLESADLSLAFGERKTLSRRFLIGGGVTILYPIFRLRDAFAQGNSPHLTGNDLAKKWMAHAEAMKRIAVDAGDQPYGAVIVKGGRIVGEGPSRVVTNHDATAHAEMEAIRDASRRLGTGNLSGCVLYGTSRPCRMCETAAYWANVSRFVYGSGIVDGGAPGYSSC